jgi:hypothetical protein
LRKLIPLVILFMLILPLAFAIGISPAKNELNLDLDNPVGEGTMRVLNNERKDMRVLIEVQGELKDYLQFDKKDFIVYSDAAEDAVHYTFDISKVPLNIRRSMKLRVYVIDMPISVSLSGSGASASTAVIYKLVINIPESISAKPVQQPVQEVSQGPSPDGTASGSSPDYVPLESSLLYEEPNISGQAFEQKTGSNMAFIYIVIALAAINLIWVLYLFRKKRNA